MKSESGCLDERFSTTRLLFRSRTDSGDGQQHGEVESQSRASYNKREGGLRTKGFVKKDLPNKPIITVVTVVFNGAQYLENTIRSVLHQNYDNVEYIVIDGGSTDGTMKIIHKYAEAINYWLSEGDEGIYDAMNKGIAAASGAWLNFMNAGDTFCSTVSVADTVNEFSEAMVYYSDTILYLKDGDNDYYRKLTCDAQRYEFIHQSCIYSRQLHGSHGMYIAAPGVTVSDYLFFRSVPREHWKKTETTISRYLVGNNISSGRRHDEQVFGVDLLFGARSITRTFVGYWVRIIQVILHGIAKSVLARGLYLELVEKYSKGPRKEFDSAVWMTPEMKKEPHE